MMQIKYILNSIKKLWTNLIDAETDISNLKKVTRDELFNNSNNENLTISLSKSVYDYSYLYVESSQATYNVIIPIYDKSQTSFRGIGGWSGNANVGSTHTQGTISNNGKTIEFSYFISIVHNSSENHAAGTSRNICKIVGVR